MSIARGAALVVLLTATPVTAFAGRPLAELELVWIEPDGTTPDRAAMKESASLLRRVGVDVRWAHGPSTLIYASQTVVILLRGRRLNGVGGAPVMGATHAGSPSRAVWIYPEAVAATLGLDEIPQQGLEREAFGLALGRVIAHELVHALLGSREHARFGLMAANLDRRDLMSPSLAVDPDTDRAMRRATVSGSRVGVNVASGPLDLSTKMPRH